MKIAILCPGYGLVARGVETFTDEISRRLVQLNPGWSVDIYCRGEDGQPDPGVRKIHVPAVDRDSSAATLYARICHRLGIFLRTRIDAECLSFTLGLGPRFLWTRYDVVFNQAGPFAGRLLQIKRGMDGTPFAHKTASGYCDLEILMAKQQPDTIIATSPYVRKWLENRVKNPKTECIPNAVDCSTFRPYSPEEVVEAKKECGLSGLKPPIVLFVGAMDPMKRPGLLVSAIAQIPDVSLVMVGDGRLTDTVVNLSKKVLGDRFVHIPRVPREKMPLFYNSCDLFSIPSEEPFGIVFLEAMACNKPVLSNHSPVQKWIFDGAGDTCDCTNIDEYASTIRRMLSTDFGNQPLVRSRSFDWSEVVPKYAQLFEELSNARRKNR